MRIALGADHRGAALARALCEGLPGLGHTVDCVGGFSGEPEDYPDVVWEVARAVADGRAERGIVICGTGIGATIAANKVRGIRAALVHDETAGELSRRHNDANVLCLAGDDATSAEALRVVGVWLRTPFDGGRHERRVLKIAAIERGEDPRGGVVHARGRADP
jgi:ribose 5-phosphate isomerase B